MDAKQPPKQSPPPKVDEDITTTRETSSEQQNQTIIGMDGQPNMSQESRIQPGSLLGKYEVKSLLGQGGMGAVYLAFDPMIERNVAIKVLPAEVSQNTNALKRFLGEARATGKLHHRNAIAIYDIGNAGEVNFIVMELATGGSVADLVAQQQPIPFTEACRIISEAGEGLVAAHAASLIHRDIKPENLMLSDDGTVKIVDFGLSKSTDVEADTRTAVTVAGQILGTPLYMSPEQFRGEQVGVGSDIYSLGATFYHLLTGRAPFEEATSLHQLMYAHLEKEPPNPCTVNPELPTGCADVVARAMAKSPNARYADVAELVEAIRTLAEGSQTKSQPTGEAARATQVESVRPRVLIIEPSNLQAMFLKDSFQRAGAESVEVVASGQQATESLGASIPHVLVTARHLPDMTGDQLIERMQSIAALRGTMMVLTSTDSRLRDVVDFESTATMAFVSKQSKPDEILRAIHICTDVVVGDGEFDAAEDLSGKRILVLSDQISLPPAVADGLRRLNAIDVTTISYHHFMARGGKHAEFDLTLCVRHSLSTIAEVGAIPSDSDSDFGRLLEQFDGRSNLKLGTVAVLGILGGSATLQCVKRRSFVAVCSIPFNETRFSRLVQIV